jgi:hypothetical protein
MRILALADIQRKKVKNKAVKNRMLKNRLFKRKDLNSKLKGIEPLTEDTQGLRFGLN